MHLAQLLRTTDQAYLELLQKSAAPPSQDAEAASEASSESQELHTATSMPSARASLEQTFPEVAQEEKGRKQKVL